MGVPKVTLCWLLLSVVRRFSAMPGFELGTERVEGSKVSRQRRGSHEMQSRTVRKQKRRKRQMNTRSVRLQVVWNQLRGQLLESVGQVRFKGLNTSSLDIAAQYQLGPRRAVMTSWGLDRKRNSSRRIDFDVVAGDGDIANAEGGHDESRERRVT
ncbi:hypothetical protein K435DRAFT_808866 [Dendrothele bispora CBS 962.96]|uniref:Secreted protein n=1 Tax=Dendrothele bispora (strain CBS 962.96) TaxID=1314807 RepID=A0A4S8L030_DENBC|nr:hypothetical protein K435DRAFT_808866 [Dendrothele bispora CBS 962.96]